MIKREIKATMSFSSEPTIVSCYLPNWSNAEDDGEPAMHKLTCSNHSSAAHSTELSRLLDGQRTFS